MQEFLQRIDRDYYRAALLLIARSELERLRLRRSTAGAKMPGKVPSGTALAVDRDIQSPVPPAIAPSSVMEIDITGCGLPVLVSANGAI